MERNAYMYVTLHRRKPGYDAEFQLLLVGRLNWSHPLLMQFLEPRTSRAHAARCGAETISHSVIGSVISSQWLCTGLGALKSSRGTDGHLNLHET